MNSFEHYSTCFRRLIDLKSWDESTAVGWLEDDYHHFGVTLSHDGAVIRDVRVAAVRYPWSPCPQAAPLLREVIGQPLIPRCTDIGRQLKMWRQCTHTFDLVGLLSAHAFHRRDHHVYEGTARQIDNDETKRGWKQADLLHDGVPVLSWQLDPDVIRAPEALAGLSIGRGFRAWAETRPEVEAERASVLRRIAALAPYRGQTRRPETVPGLEEKPALCFTFQPETRAGATRDGERTAMRHFADSAEGMIAYRDTCP
jgi:hypothetical protein